MFCRILKETRWRAWEQLHHVDSLSIFSQRLLLGSFDEGSEKAGSTVTVLAVRCTADREPLNVETILYSGLAGTWILQTKRSWKRACAPGETFSIQQANLTSPLPLFLWTISQHSICSHLTEEMNQKLIYSAAAHLFISQAVTTAHLCCDQWLKSCPSRASVTLNLPHTHNNFSGSWTETRAAHSMQCVRVAQTYTHNPKKHIKKKWMI